MKPEILWGYDSSTGEHFRYVRISNVSIIDNPENLVLHNNIFIGHFTHIDATEKITIGQGCQISNYVLIATHSSHNSIRIYGDKGLNVKDKVGFVSGEIEIGAFTFIGAHSTIMPNTKIGKGSIVKAYSYVRGEFPPFSIIAGNPAKVVGDTRAKDQALLEQHPELTEAYNKWWRAE